MPQVLQRNNTLSQLTPACLSSITGPTMHPLLIRNRKRSASFVDVLNRSTTEQGLTPPTRFYTYTATPSCTNCRSKRRRIATSSANHHYAFPAFLSNEASFPFWYKQIQDIISKKYPDYLVLELIPTQPVEDECYLQKLQNAHTLCAQNEFINQEINHLLFEYIDEKWAQYLTTDLASENFETIKHIFQSKITGNYLIELESNLTFDRSDVQLFLASIDLLSQVYFIVFKETADQKVKAHWAMNALLRTPNVNKDIISQLKKVSAEGCEQCIISFLQKAH